MAALALVGCGELDPARAPVDAAKDDFCGAWVRVADADPAVAGDDLDDYLRELARYGTPRGIPTAARNGYEYLIDPERSFANAAAVLAVAQQTDAAGEDVAALALYAEQTCG